MHGVSKGSDTNLQLNNRFLSKFKGYSTWGTNCISIFYYLNVFLLDCKSFKPWSILSYYSTYLWLLPHSRCWKLYGLDGANMFFVLWASLFSLSAVTTAISLGERGHKFHFALWPSGIIRFPESLGYTSFSGNTSPYGSVNCLKWSVSLSAVSNSFSSVQSLSCVQLWEPRNCSTPGFPVHHPLLDLVQTHVHWISNALQPSHPLSSPPPAFDLCDSIDCSLN